MRSPDEKRRKIKKLNEACGARGIRRNEEEEEKKCWRAGEEMGEQKRKSHVPTFKLSLEMVWKCLRHVD